MEDKNSINGIVVGPFCLDWTLSFFSMHWHSVVPVDETLHNLNVVTVELMLFQHVACHSQQPLENSETGDGCHCLISHLPFENENICGKKD
jgi:hypothetical protein